MLLRTSSIPHSLIRLFLYCDCLTKRAGLPEACRNALSPLPKQFYYHTMLPHGSMGLYYSYFDLPSSVNPRGINLIIVTALKFLIRIKLFLPMCNLLDYHRHRTFSLYSCLSAFIRRRNQWANYHIHNIYR